MLVTPLAKLAAFFVGLLLLISSVQAETSPTWTQATALFKQASFDKTREASDL